MNRKILILLIFLTPLFVAAGLQIPSMFNPYSFNESRLYFMESELDAKHSLPSRSITPISLEIDYDSLGKKILTPDNSLVYVGVNNTVHLTNNSNETQVVAAENMYFHARTLKPHQTHIFSISTPGEYVFYLEDDKNVQGKFVVLPSILSQTFHFPKTVGKYFEDWQNPSEAATVRGYSFAETNGHAQTWSNFYSDIPSDISVTGIEVVLLGSISGMFPAGVNVELTWDGQNYTNSGNSVMWEDSLVRTSYLGDNENTWGHKWVASDLEGDSFGIRLEKIGDENSTVNIDQIAIKVFLE